MNIAIIYGGKSVEHEISVITALGAYEALKDKYEVSLLYFNKSNELFLLEEPIFINNKKPIKISLINGGYMCKKHKKRLDMAILCTHGGAMEGGGLQGLLELYNICYTGSDHITSSILIDKIFTKEILKNNDIPVVEYTYSKNVINYSMPCIVKPSRLGSSIGIKVCYDNLEKSIIEGLEFDERVLIEKYLKEFKEYNIAVLSGDEVVLSNIEEVYKSDDILSYDDKYKSKSDKRIIPAIIDEKIENEIKEIALKSTKILNIKGVVRFDFLYDGKLYLNEINSIPGSLAYYLFDISYLDLLENLMKIALLDFQRKAKRKTHFDIDLLDIRGAKK